jgi:3'(2'), 5'-bisphosphate nucleotidase
LKNNPTYQLAIKAAVEASKLLMQFYTDGFSSEIKIDGSPVTEADIASSTLIKEILSETQIPIIDEESDALSYKIRKTWTKCWCVDPLDGTKEFIKKNGEFAVNIALIENQKAIFGIIASPVKEEIILGGKDIGVYLVKFSNIDRFENWKEIKFTNSKEKINIIASRSHESSKTSVFINHINEKLKKCGIIHKGSALKFFELAQNQASIYPRFAPTMEWDIAAGQAIMEALGGKILDTSSFKPLIYNKENLLNPYFVAFTQEFSEDFFENSLLLSK